MKKILTLFLFVLFLFPLSAQDGAPLLTHFRESRETENQSWAICQDNNNVMLFANRKGILAFDGQDWQSIKIPTIPYSLQANPVDGSIYVGGDNSFGKLVRAETGQYKYIALSGDSSSVGVITKIVFDKNLVWFYGEQSITRYNLETGKSELCLRSKTGYPFTGMLVNSKNTFVNVMDKGLFRVENDTLFPIVTGYLTEKTDILFSLPYNNEKVLVGLSDGNLSLFDGIKYYDYPVKDDGYLRDNILSEGIAIGDSLYAFSTLDGGAMVIERKNGNVRFTINNQNELPDDEVFATGLDRNGGLWLSHQYGLSRADLKLPVQNYSIYPGLTGNLSAALKYNNELFVSSSEGVFYLTEVKNYAEIQVMVKDETASSKQAESEQAQQSSRKNIFSRIFGKKISKEQTPVAQGGTVNNENKNKSENKYVNKTVNRLKSVNYLYKKVEGFNEKCRQLVSTSDGILAATNKGLFIINNHKATQVGNSRYINSISWQPDDGKYYIAAGDGYFTVRNVNGRWITESPDPSYSDAVYSIVKTSSGTLWLGSDNMALRVDQGKMKYSKFNIKNDFPQRYNLGISGDTVFLLTDSGIYYFEKNKNEFLSSNIGRSSAFTSLNFLYPLSNKTWIRHGAEWINLGGSSGGSAKKEIPLLKIFSEVVYINDERGNMLVIDGENRLFRINLTKSTKINPESDVFIKRIFNESGSVFNLSDVVFNRGDKIVNFDVVAPGYLKQNTTQYQYTVSKLMSEWSPWSERTSYNLMISDPGDYVLKVRAKDLWGNIGEPVSLKFTIKAPFTQTLAFYILVIVVVLSIIVAIVRFRERSLQEKNMILEEKVRERTAEIEAQKQEITSSIEYASRIQLAMLPEKNHFETHFSDYFILYKPRDIVSGDFYWVGENEKHIFFTVADCTGHGVPGAFMSALGISTLQDIITNNSDLTASSVLGLLREKIKTSLHQTGKEGEAADGMDVAFCVLHKNKKILEYSGAFNPLLICQNGELKEYKADRMPIGIYYGEKRLFTNYEINIKKGDTIYVFSDGYVDQFGGPDGSKYKLANFKKLLSKIHDKSMEEQYKIIHDELTRWKGTASQVDDITILGIRI
jgi:serine phosphatase RsbU (regulator of sigma subunit)